VSFKKVNIAELVIGDELASVDPLAFPVAAPRFVELELSGVLELVV